MRTLRFAFIVLAAGGLALPIASAQTTTQTTTTTASGSSSSAGTLGAPHTVESGHALTDDQAAMEEANPRPAPDDGISARPDETNHDYFSVGFLARGVIVPDFMISAFVSYRGPNAHNGGMGGFFSWRRNGLTLTAEVWYGGLSGQGFFHGMSAADTETEYVNSQLGAIFGNLVFQWAVPVTPWFSIDIGLGLGLGGVYGNLYRQEAAPAPGSQYGYQMCSGIGSPNGAYCEGPVEMPGATGRLDDSRQRGGTYQLSTNGMPGTGTGPNPFYFGDGGVPPIFPWLDLPRITARFNPIRQLLIRVDLGYTVFGFHWGGALGYQF